MKFLAAILLAATVAGCAHYQARPLSPAQNAAELESRSLTNAALRVFLEKNLKHEPPAEFDIELLTLVAYYYHPDLAVARAQWDVAEAGIKTAGGRPNPTLSLVPGYNTTTAIPSPWFPAVNFDIPIETAGKRGHRIRTATELSAAARLNIATVAWQVRSRVQAALFELKSAKWRDELVSKQVQLQEKAVTLLEQQANAGAITAVEVAPFRIALQKGRIDAANARTDRANAHVHLAEAIGIPAAALDERKLYWKFGPWPSTFDEFTTAESVRRTLQSRTDILAALAEYAATEATLQTEIAKQYPDIHLNPGYQFDQGENKWSLGITFDLPVLNQNQGPIAEAKARREEAAARFMALQVKVLAEIDRAIAALLAGKSNVATADALGNMEVDRLNAAEARFKAGDIAQLDYVNAQADYAAAQLAQIAEHMKYLQAMIQLEDALQRPLALQPREPEPSPQQEKP